MSWQTRPHRMPVPKSYRRGLRASLLGLALGACATTVPPPPAPPAPPPVAQPAPVDETLLRRQEEERRLRAAEAAFAACRDEACRSSGVPGRWPIPGSTSVRR
jgi:hypothetical protein